MGRIRRCRAHASFILAMAVLLQQLVFLFPVRAVAAAPVFVSDDLVISQVYGAGGNSGATYTHDFVELFNRGNVAVSLSGKSIQYASATGTGNFGGTATQITELPNVVLQPGQYYLVQQAGGTTGAPLPTPNLVDPTPIAMAAGAGKVALVNSNFGLGCNGSVGQPCSAEQLALIIDLVGYGNANFFEGTGPAPTISSTTSASRAGNGCTDTDENSTDFTAGAINPRNMASPANVCGGTVLPTDPTATGSASPSSVFPGESTLLTVTVTPGQNPLSTGIAVRADLSSIGGSATQMFADQGENVFTYNATVDGATTTGLKSLGVTVTDGQERNASTSISLQVAEVVVGPQTVRISQVYGGGGNSGAFYTNDFIELYNYGSDAVSLAGWSVQYTSAAGTGTWQTTPLGGTIAPGGYYLIQQAAGTGGTAALPTPDATGSIMMAGGSGKVALRSDVTAVSGSCPVGNVDLVGYGSTACFEGTGSTAQLSNTTAAIRKRGGCVDTDNNNSDFSVGAPTPRNSASPIRSCDFMPLSINQIQGDGAQTPYLGQDVATTGIVTAHKSNGFFLQEPDATVDADPNTSEAIFVFTGSAPQAAVGANVTVQGQATEFFNLTQVDATAGSVTVNSVDNFLPTPIVFNTTILDPNGTNDQLERFEGMRVTVNAVRSVAPTNNFGEIYTVIEGVTRPFREPGIEAGLPIPPDPVTGTTDCCIPIWDRNPERIMIDTDGLAGSTRQNVTSGVLMTDVTGPLDYSFDEYKILPETMTVAEPNLAGSAVRDAAPGEFTVASFNIQNFANGTNQRLKAANAIRTLMKSPDIVGAIEIASLTALQALAEQVNADTVAAGGADPEYDAVLIPAEGSTQNVGFLVKTSRVAINSVVQMLADQTYDDPSTGNPLRLHDRPPLVMNATVNKDIAPREVIVVVNHTRSFIGIEGVDAEGARVREKRKRQAETIAELFQAIQTGNPATPLIAVGDYNAYEFSDGYTNPIATFKGLAVDTDFVVVSDSPDLIDPDLINLTDTLPQQERYTYIFEGTPQALDHILINPAANAIVTGYDVMRGNVDFPNAPEFSDPTRPENSSDHDAPVAYFKFAAQETTTSVPNVNVTYNVNGQNVELTASVGGALYTVNEGAVTFTVTTAGGDVVGTAGPATVVDGVATANFALPGSVMPQALTITAEYSGGVHSEASTGVGTLVVSYAVCLLYDPTRVVQSGDAYPIKVQLCDVNGVNVSSSSTVVTAINITSATDPTVIFPVQTTGKANKNNEFRYDSGGYIFNLSTKGLPAGSYNLNFTAGSDPTIHSAGFVVE